jgi:hypothetical protein
MKAKPVYRLHLRWMGFTLILLVGVLSSIESCSGGGSGAAPTQQEGSSNWDEMKWDKDKWS